MRWRFFPLYIITFAFNNAFWSSVPSPQHPVDHFQVRIRTRSVSHNVWKETLGESLRTTGWPSSRSKLMSRIQLIAFSVVSCNSPDQEIRTWTFGKSRLLIESREESLWPLDYMCARQEYVSTIRATPLLCFLPTCFWLKSWLWNLI